MPQLTPAPGPSSYIPIYTFSTSLPSDTYTYTVAGLPATSLVCDYFSSATTTRLRLLLYFLLQHHASLWRFLEALKKEQNFTRMKLSRMRMMLDPATRAAKWRRYDDRLERLCNSFDQDTGILDYRKKFSLAV